MAFCGKCGTQLHENATFCANCGAPTGVSDPVANQPVMTTTAPHTRGFFGSLFDFSFTTFVTGKLIKVLYVLAILVLALAAVGFVVFSTSPMSTISPIAAIVIAPIVFLLYVILVRVQLEILIVIFRMSEHLGEIRELIKRRE